MSPLDPFRAVLKHYWDLGLTSCGGPAVHVIILRKRFVESLKWLDEQTFLDLFALGNALPGPGSTQLAFSIAVITHGVFPGVFAFFLWSIPGAIGMAGIGAGVSRIPSELPGIVLAFLTGLNAAAVGLIALAAWQLGSAASTDRLSTLLVWLGASFGICYHAPWMYPVLIVAGGLATLIWDHRRRIRASVKRVVIGERRDRRTRPRGNREESGMELRPRETSTARDGGQEGEEEEVAEPPSRQSSARGDHQPSGNSIAESQASPTAPPMDPTEAGRLDVVSTRTACLIIFGFVLLLTGPLAARAGLRNAGKAVPRGLDFFGNMLIAGTIIFGGGPVVIPLLRDYVVAEGWVSSRDFLLVFAILQAFPGPNFNYAVALGVLANPSNRALGALLGYLGIFSPGIILKLGLLPLYASWRGKPISRSILRGLNSVASGLVFTAVWQLFLIGYIYTSPSGRDQGGETGGQGQGQGQGRQTVSGPLTLDPFWAVVSSGALVACKWFAAPPWLSIILGALAGLAWHGVQVK
ncbi:chromate transporter-domain-containing protein [Kockovaella imperatae]|uniref:Chromate transporter-domain-containing protein n=1 Tax=Kockovaella imperatae TaxID=4999 RepID=A0A1Y1UIQ8_9TREE|nr:chromate transporter-domain-containing protein [Kockovaella imperatae]ORX37921.1 chromate transporter-domain-containing protein [Kockovaella imperatae]